MRPHFVPMFALAVALLLPGAAPAQEGKKEPKTVVAALGQDGVQRAEILGGSYFFDPARVVVQVNVPVELTVKKESGFAPHDFQIKAPEAGIDVSASLDTKPKVVKFTPTQAGVYPFFCSKSFLGSTHRGKGMEGVLEVR